jgi:hypothetical protein
MVTQYGMSELGPIQYEKPGGSVFLGRDYNSTQSNYSTQIAFEIDKAVRDIIDLCHKKATELLTEHKDDVILIAETLIEHETITADQIEYLLKNKKLPEEDEHKLAQAEENTPKNANNIVLYPGYEPFYLNVDKIVEKQPCRLVLVVSNPGSGRIGIDEFKNACTSGATDPSKIGVMFVSANDRKAVSLSVESFAFHIESYAGVPVLLIKTDEAAVKELKEHYEIA